MKIKKPALAILIFAALSLVPLFLRADDLDEGRRLLADGDLQAAAEILNRYAASHPDDSKKTPEALALCGRALDGSADALTGAAEKACYWTKGGGGSPDCMQQHAAKYNRRFGADSFRYEHAITYVVYTGAHYRKILENFPKSAYVPEADFYLLLHSLVGHPDTVMPRIKAFLAKYPKGEWNRKGLLLWARVNEDIWYVHRKWSWVLYNYQIAPDELLIRAEPYRQEALRAYETLMKSKKTFESKVAEQEYALLKNNRENERTFSIVNDSIPGTMMGWGVETSGSPVIGPANTATSDAEVEAVSTEVKNKSPKIPKRFQ